MQCDGEELCLVRSLARTQSTEQLNQTMEYVLNELQCAICLELFQCPVILPCSHILCRSPCATRLFDNGFIRCPVCRDNSFVIGGIETFPRVIAIENIINRYRNEAAAISEDEVCQAQDVACQLCRGTPRRATRSCLDCNASYCNQCLQLSHPAKEPFTGHKLVDAKKYLQSAEMKCLQHDEETSLYCPECKAVCCVVCQDSDLHRDHTMMSLNDAFDSVKEILEDSLKGLEASQEVIVDALKDQTEHLQKLKGIADIRQTLIAEQCDSLISEINAKRSLFTSDVKYEAQSHISSTEDAIKGYKKQQAVTQGLIHYGREVLKEKDPRSFLQVADSVVEKLQKNTPKRDDFPNSSLQCEGFLQRKVVDFRKEKALLRDLTYLSAPATPSIDVMKCSRSTTSVVIVLSPSSNERDVINGYHVYFCSEEEKQRGEQEIMTFETPHEERTFGRTSPSTNAVCLIHNNLQSYTMYFFCVKAYNMAGESETSEIINCSTLSSMDTTIPVPEITENSCRTFSSSIQICSSSPMDCPSEENISHFLLYREYSNRKIWKSVAVYGRVEHRVFGLEPDTLYCFVIMACNKEGECQISKEVVLRTKLAAY